MPTPRHLQNAPITEAIIDFRVKARADLCAEDFAGVKDQLSNRLPKLEEMRGLQATFQVLKGKGQPPLVQDLGLQGYFFKSQDEKVIAQFRIDGFTLNRLRPYTSWEDIFPQAMELWRVYLWVAKPAAVIRLAVRYINHIPLPPGTEKFENYLRAAPVIPPELPQYVSSFLTRVTIHNPEDHVAAHVTQALQPTTDVQRLTVILDIDAYKEAEFLPEDPAIERTFMQLRAFKNMIFFNSLTDQALRHFE
ncbi:MAG: TIGR04255 family protein [Deltaproteobacteria bacterium]|nr:TIGR04255 family protein [Deltaproteobacteria bacterium]